MRKFHLPLLIVTIMSLPAPAIGASYDNANIRPGTFAGVRLQMSLGGKSSRKARAALAIAPTSSRISDGAIIQTWIGEGIALNLGSRPTVTLAGVRADQALGLVSKQGLESDQKQGLSTGGWIAVGVGAAAVAATIYGIHMYVEAEKNSD